MGVEADLEAGSSWRSQVGRGPWLHLRQEAARAGVACLRGCVWSHLSAFWVQSTFVGAWNGESLLGAGEHWAYANGWCGPVHRNKMVSIGQSSGFCPSSWSGQGVTGLRPWRGQSTSPVSGLQRESQARQSLQQRLSPPHCA